MVEKQELVQLSSSYYHVSLSRLIHYKYRFVRELSIVISNDLVYFLASYDHIMRLNKGTSVLEINHENLSSAINYYIAPN
jgi:hypothetical protein